NRHRRKIALDKPTFCGTITTARERREKRLSKPQPWLVRKLTVPLTAGIMRYAGYVYAGRFAVRLMRGGRRREYISKTPQLLLPALTRTQADWDAYDAQREQDRREQAEAYAAHASSPQNPDVADDATSSFDWRDRAERDEDGMGEGRVGGPVYAPPNPAANGDENPTPPTGAPSRPPHLRASPPVVPTGAEGHRRLRRLGSNE
ncbi:hypothetical protein C8R45DRAFT_1022218, partial [Mycena sanguinolenta]